MGKTGRNVLAVLLGVVSGVIVIAASDALSEALYPLPEGVDPRDPAALSEAMRTMPAGAIALLLLGWCAGCFAGGWAAARVGVGAKLRLALTTGGILLAGAVLTALSVPPPVWFWGACVLLFVPCAFLGGKLAAGREPEPVSEAIAA